MPIAQVSPQQPQRDYPERNMTLAELLEKQASRSPDALALVDDASNGREWSYRDYDDLVVTLAHRLSGAGVRRGSRVGVLALRSVHLVAALHATVRAGAAYVPLDPEYPDDRLSYMIEETAMKVVLADAELAPRVSGNDLTVLELGDSTPAETAAAGAPEEPTNDEATPDDPAYVIYTSGSTGRPKGVENGHRGVVNRLLWMQETYELKPGSVVLQKTPYSFDVSVWEFFWPLMFGATLVVAEPDGHRDPSYLIQTINRYQVDTIHFVPSMLRVFLEHPRASTCTSLKRVICSGEALTRDLVNRFFDTLPECELHNLYGPTEAAIDVTAYQCMPDDPDAVVPIGRPVANTSIHILNEEGEPVAPGAEGEIYIGGVQVAHGYVNRPDLTAECFVDHPHFGRLYKTGDLGCIRESGDVEFRGRVDHQIKLRGLRIELAEIEANLEDHPEVSEAVVVPQGDAESVRLEAHVLPRSDRRPDEKDLRAFLGDRLPPYMIPELWRFHRELPLTTSGKADRRALAASTAAPERDSVLEQAPSDLEGFLLHLWQQILGRSDFGPDDPVFDLGATSLDAARFANRVQAELDEFIYVVTVFTHPSISAYADLLRHDYGPAVARRFGEQPKQESERETQVDVRLLSSVAEAVPKYGPFPLWSEGPKNPTMAFVLAPPRSGTTLLRVMLAGHPELFAVSELQLLGFDSLAQRRAAFSGADRIWLEGTIRMLMEMKSCDAEEATSLMERLESEDLSSKQFYRWVQERIDERLLIDKSPAYACDLEAMRNAERGFARAKFLHLTRHPVATTRSFESYHMDQILHLDRSREIPGARQLGEAIWTISHRNILTFCEEVEEDRVLRIRFEDLVSEPETSIRQVAEFLGVQYVPAMGDPYSDLGSRMVDGIHPESTPMGDTRLLEHKRIDPAVAQRWSDMVTELGEPTCRVARRLGYEDDPVSSGTNGTSRRRATADATRDRRGRRGSKRGRPR